MKSKWLVTIAIIIILIFILAAGAWLFREQAVRYVFQPTASVLEEGIATDRPADGPEGKAGDQPGPGILIVAEDLKIPWEIAFLPDGQILLTERPGNLLLIGDSGRLIIPVPDAEHVGEGGLLGLALHPEFDFEPWVYLYYTVRRGGAVRNEVARWRWTGDNITDKEILIADIPGASVHNGGRIAFGPDGFLYITSGDAGNPALAQDLNSLAGKILRVSADGKRPADNPFNSAVYSYGHRNPQGLAWDGAGRLWATEHGRSGLQSGLDELNLIEAGANYGWPEIEGDEEQAGMRRPAVHSGPDETWAPAGIVFWQGRLFFTGLRGQSLYEAAPGEGVSVSVLKAHFRGEFGRLRAMAAGPDGRLYITTSNTDGRGSVRSGDDKLIRINPAFFVRAD